MALDERVRRELERAARPADPSGVYEHLIRRREGRRIARRIQTAALTLVVIAGSTGGFFVLSRVFREGTPPDPVAPGVSNGQIVVSRDVPGEGLHLFAASPDGSDVRRLTPDGRAVYRSPDVSPDGRTVVVAHEIPSFEPGQSVLATVPVDGGSPTWLTEETWVVRDPAWSPDGGRIAFAGSPGGPFGIYVFDVDTGDVELVPGTDDNSVGHPTWSPDGSRIAFEASTGSDIEIEQLQATWDVYSAAVDGAGMTNLTNTPDESETQPAWSWVADRISFVQSGPAEGALLTMSSTGADLVTVFSGELAPANPVWSPDGRVIAFEAGSDGIFIADIDGAGPLVVPNIAGSNPTWQPVPEGAVVVPSPSPSPSPSPQAGEDIGLGFPVCDVTSVLGEFEPGVVGTAYVATRMSDTGGCPQSDQGALQVLAVDVTGDQIADVSLGTLECEPFCSAFAAPDIDGDGADELLVQNVQFSIAGVKLYEVIGDRRIVPITIGAGGGSEAFGYEGFEGGTEPQFWVGGDAGAADAIRCEPYEGRRAFVSTTSFHPIDTNEDITVIETFFLLKGTFLSVVDVNEFTWPAEDDSRPFLDTGGCGVNLDPYD